MTRGPQPESESWIRRGAWRIELFAWQSLSLVLWQLGHRWTLALGGSLGRLLPVLSPRRLRIARDDLRRVFAGSKSEAEIDAIARESLVTLCAALAELLWLARAGRRELETLVELDETSLRLLAEASAHRQPVILVGIHFGRWELMFLGANLGGLRFALVTRPLANPYLDAYFSRIRSRLGNSIVHVDDLRSLHARLGAGEVLLISMDHRTHKRDAVLFDFLGQPTPLTTGIARLALRHGAALLPIYALPGRGYRLRIEIGPALPFTPSGDTRRDVERITQQCADAMGAVIRRHPQYWMWSHKRLWRSKPDDPVCAGEAAKTAGAGRRISGPAR